MRPRPDAVHGARLKIDEHRTGHVLALVTLVVVDIDALQLQVLQVLVGTSVLSIGLDTVLVADDLPELQDGSQMIVG